MDQEKSSTSEIVFSQSMSQGLSYERIHGLFRGTDFKLGGWRVENGRVIVQYRQIVDSQSPAHIIETNKLHK